MGNSATMIFHKTILLSILSSSLVLATPTCDECTQAFGNLVTRLTGEESLMEQMDLLKTFGCGVMENPDDCNNLVDEWWGVMASILYPSLMVPQDLCTMAGSCTEYSIKDWTCDDCIGGVVMAAGYFETEESIQMGVDLLSGDAFCGAPDATEDCAEQMAVWLPVAIPILADAFRAQEIEICQEEVGVCMDR